MSGNGSVIYQNDSFSS